MIWLLYLVGSHLMQYMAEGYILSFIMYSCYNDDKKLNSPQTKPLPGTVVLKKILDDNDDDGEGIENCSSELS